ncbi:hypothetical protein N7509_004469 [Penicillium cosmopolitanum]|uniref:Uncharacterized protein n=1 Tax=Penicillium cosmopolitanum TaxID=1131564 RepID=A0A9W9W6Z0_9EURO|nr:uncharacterized protein N7509_004469 [Penicillium cosmopolitanum]KAJ5404598.1 hypothetical protein N7509_004469 [Penicillium cosmopolitanum]
MTTERRALEIMHTTSSTSKSYANQPVESKVADHLETPQPTITDDDPSSTISLSSLKQELDDIHKDTKALLEEHMQLASIPFPAQDLDTLRTNADLSWSFVLVIAHLQHQHYGRARMEIRRAMSFAHAVDDKHSIARCHYWLGRIPLQRGRFNEAYAYFDKAKPDLNGRVSSEGETVDFYLMVCTPGMSPQYRTQLLREYSQSVTKRYLNQDDETSSSFFDRRHQNPRKRKRELHDITIALRQADLSSSHHRHSLNRSMGQNRSPARKVVWMIPNTDDLEVNRHQEPDMSNISDGKTVPVVDSRGTPTGTTQMKFPILAAGRRHFTFRCYPVGLSGSRARHMNIISRQPGEPALSIEEGQKLQAAMKTQKITMGYLEREREFLAGRATFGTLQEAPPTDDSTDSDLRSWGTDVEIVVEVE